MFMNEYEVERARDKYRGTEPLGEATEVLANLMWWTNSNSDGWPYWQAPRKAAARLVALIQSVEAGPWGQRRDEETITAAEVRRTYAPIKAFLTKRGVDHAVIFGGAQ